MLLARPQHVIRPDRQPCGLRNSALLLCQDSTPTGASCQIPPRLALEEDASRACLSASGTASETVPTGRGGTKASGSCDCLPPVPQVGSMVSWVRHVFLRTHFLRRLVLGRGLRQN